MAILPLATLVIQQGKTAFYNKALALATTLGLPVSTWHAGDPTRSLYHLESEALAALEPVVVGFIRSGFLDYIAELAATGDAGAKKWLKIRAQQDFGVTVPEATFATTDVVLTNTAGGRYPIAAGDLTFKSSTTDKTYHNTTGGLLPSKPTNGDPTTLTVTVVADEPGSDSSASAGEIDELVTARLGVVCSNPTAAVGVDEQAPATTVQQCRDKLGTLSFIPPKEAYAYVAKTPELTGTTAVLRARAFGDSETGDVLLYLASANGGVAEPDRALVELAILKYATGLTITPTVLSATPVIVPVTYALYLYKSVNKTSDEIEEEVEESLETLFSTREIGGDIIATDGSAGALYTSLIESTIRNVYPSKAFRVEVSVPSTNTLLTNNQVATLGLVTATIYLVVDP